MAYSDYDKVVFVQTDEPDVQINGAVWINPDGYDFVYSKSLKRWIHPGSVYSDPYNRGYISIDGHDVDELSFSDETRTTEDLILNGNPTGYMIGTSSSVRGYYFGGNDGTNNISTVQKFNFESSSHQVLGTVIDNLTDYDKFMVGGNSTTHGYVMTTSKLSKLKHSDESLSKSYADISLGSQFDRIANSRDYMYINEGTTGFKVIKFSDDDTMLSMGSQSHSNNYNPGAIDNKYAGYFAGNALNPGANVEVSTISKLSFSTNSFTLLSATISQEKGYIQSINSSLSGYYAAGVHLYGSMIFYTTIDKFAFSTETCGAMSITTSDNTANGDASIDTTYYYRTISF